MARGKGNSGPRSRTTSPVNAATKNGHKTGGHAKPVPKKQSEKNGPSLSTSKMSKQKSAAKGLSQKVEDAKKLKKRAGNGLVKYEDNALATTVTLTVKSEGGIPVGRANVAKKSTTSAAAREAIRSRQQRVDNNKPNVVANGRFGHKRGEDDAKGSPPLPKMKIDVNFEDDSDDSENEGLKQLMEKIDQTLVCPPPNISTVATDKSPEKSLEVAVDGGDKPLMTTGEQLWFEMVASEKTSNKTARDDDDDDEEEPKNNKNQKRSRSNSLSPVVCIENGSFKKNKTVKLKKAKAKVIDVSQKNDVTSEIGKGVVAVKCNSKSEEPKDVEPETLRVDERKLKPLEQQVQAQENDEEEEQEEEKKISEGDEQHETSIVLSDSKSEVPSESSCLHMVAVDTVAGAVESETESLPTSSHASVQDDEQMEEIEAESSSVEVVKESDAQPKELSVTNEVDKGVEKKKKKKNKKKKKKLVAQVEKTVASSPVCPADEATASEVGETPIKIEESEPEVRETSPPSENINKDDKKEVLDDTKPDECGMVVNDEELVESKTKFHQSSSDVEPLLKRKREMSEPDKNGGSTLSEKKVKLKVTCESKTDANTASAAAASGSNKCVPALPERSMLRRIFGVQRQTQQCMVVAELSTAAADKNGGSDDHEDATATATSEDVQLTSVAEVEEVNNNSTTAAAAAVVVVAAAEPEAAAEEPEATTKKQMYRMSKSELEMLIMSKVTEYFTDSDKSEIGALRRRCEYLEKALDVSKRKGNQCQKQLTDLQIVIQRAQLAKKPGFAAKPLMRSVGLQVQLTRYIPVSSSDTSKAAPPQRMTYGGNVVRPTTLVPSAMGVSTSTSVNGPRMNNMKQVPSGLTFVSSMSGTTPLGSRTYMSANRTPPTVSQNNSVTITGCSAVRAGAPVIRLPIGDKTINVRPVSATNQVGNNQMGISLLQPRMSLPHSQTLNQSLVFSAPIVTTSINAPNLVNRLSALSTPGAVTGMRPHLEASKIVSVTCGVTPVPMRLVPNQAARQTTGGGIISSAATTTTPGTVVSPNKNALIGQPKLASVKLIDLTADEEAAAAAAAASSSAAAAAPLLTTINATNSAGLTVVQSGKSLQAAAGMTNTVSVLSSAMSSTGQILTINTSGAITTTMNSLRMATPVIRTSTVATGIPGQPPMRYAYLVPSTSVVTMVRPSQPLFVTQNQGQRLGQPTGILKPNVPTIVFQRGTTLVPLQGQMASIQNIRPSAINVRPQQTPLLNTNTITITTNAAPAIRTAAPTIVPPSNAIVVQQLPPPLLPPPLPQPPSSVSVTPAPSPITPKIALPSTTAPMLASTPPKVTLPQPTPNISLIQKPSARPAAISVVTTKGTHPAPLPQQPMYTTIDLLSRKCMPPKPVLKISKVTNGIVLSWNMPLNVTYAEISSYQLYAYQEGTSPPATALWKKVGDVRALPLPMACTLTQFVEGHKYYFAVRAVDAHSRIGPFSEAGSIALMVANITTTKQSSGKS